MRMIERLTTDMKAAMKARDSQRRNALRLLLAELKNDEKAKNAELTPEEEIDSLSRQAKRRRDSIEAYEKAERQDLLDQELFELSVIEEYLPEQLTPEDARAIVAEVIAEVGATGKQQMGLVMKSAMPKLKGRFPGKDVKGIVMSLLD